MKTRSRRQSRVRAEEVTEMARMLKSRGYSQPNMYARKLAREGMGPYELEHILKTTRAGGMGSLEYTHNFRRASGDPRRAGRSYTRPTRAQQARISRKIRILRREGYGEKQAVAIAYNMAGVARVRRRRR